MNDKITNGYYNSPYRYPILSVFGLYSMHIRKKSPHLHYVGVRTFRRSFKMEHQQTFPKSKGRRIFIPDNKPIFIETSYPL